MLKVFSKPLSGHALREAGWQVLVRNMGPINATRFILQSESGIGDYLKIRKNLFKGKTAAGIVEEIEAFEKADRR